MFSGLSVRENELLFIKPMIIHFCVICRIISEFEAIRERALTKPEDTREMIDMLKFVEEAKTKTLVKLDSDIKVNTWMLIIPVWPHFFIQYIIDHEHH